MTADGRDRKVHQLNRSCGAVETKGGGGNEATSQRYKRRGKTSNEDQWRQQSGEIAVGRREAFIADAMQANKKKLQLCTSRQRAQENSSSSSSVRPPGAVVAGGLALSAAPEASADGED